MAATQKKEETLLSFVQLNKNIRVFYSQSLGQDTKEAPKQPQLILQLFLATLPRRFLAKTTFHTFQQENLYHIIGSNWHTVLYGAEALVLSGAELKSWKAVPNQQDPTQSLLSEVIHDTVHFWMVFFEAYVKDWNDQFLLLFTLLLQACYDFELVQDYDRILTYILTKIETQPDRFSIYGMGYFFALQ